MQMARKCLHWIARKRASYMGNTEPCGLIAAAAMQEGSLLPMRMERNCPHWIARKRASYIGVPGMI